jgi:hypothetical protein
MSPFTRGELCRSDSVRRSARTGTGPQVVAADDFNDTRELVAVIRGSDGGRRTYGIGDTLPAVYTPRCSTTRSSKAGGATGHRPPQVRMLGARAKTH